MSARPRLDDLFAAAREDAPPPMLRDEMWGRIAAATAPPAAASIGKAAAAPSATKLVGVGVLLGAATTIVAALAVTYLPDDGAPSKARRPPAAVARVTSVHAHLADPTPRARAEIAPIPTPSTSAARVATDALPSVAAIDEASTLEEETRIVTEMRAALLRGEAGEALVLAARARKLPVRALEPEELALELRALRALGRVDEALAIELTLRRRFPGHALSR